MKVYVRIASYIQSEPYKNILKKKHNPYNDRHLRIQHIVFYFKCKQYQSKQKITYQFHNKNEADLKTYIVTSFLQNNLIQS